MSRAVFPERLVALMPTGTREAIRSVCNRHGLCIGDFVREAVSRQLAACGADVPVLLDERRPNLPSGRAGQ